ncbi:Riboflavin kinase/FMN hydrolase [Hibiscus syriacus]|uniref:Riboflavin kinase/FMN hydrolase n=1 Tax=Hibiscus syriacus TaxID=106335 RepID=A0A6A2WFW8_HIBSY|nr:Riboflavin kinase/FMN hydrolase [Hibiscus syriacus]
MEEEYEGEAPVQPSKPRGRHIKKRATKNKALSVSFNEKDLRYHYHTHNTSYISTVDRGKKINCELIRDYVTGFHKRKKKRRKEAQKKQEQAERRKKVLSIWEIKGKPSPLSKRHCLVLDTEICEWDIPGIFEFDQSFFDFYEVDGEEFLDSTNWFFKCFLQSLEDIELAGFQQNSSGSQFLVKFMKFLLRRGKVLKKVAIYEQSGALHKSWKFSRPKMKMELENAKRNQIISTLSSCILFNVVSE